MPFVRLVYVFALWSCAAAAHAAVAESDAAHFKLAYTLAVPATPARAYAATVDVAHWWSSDHTYSGDAKNLNLRAQAGGCWCEKLPGGGVTHMTVLAALPGRLLRLGGGLGPLQSGALNGTLTFEFAAKDSGTEIKVSYSVAGWFDGGLDKAAPGVDKVLGDQLERLRGTLEAKKP